MRPLTEPRLVNDAFGDPALYVDLRDEPLLRVRAAFVDHGIPCLAFALDEKARVRVDRAHLDALGVAIGPWLRTLELAVLAGAGTPITVAWRDAAGAHCRAASVGELADVVLDVRPGQRIGYVTDLCYSDAKLRTLASLLQGVDRLFIECVFLHADVEHARHKNHLTARDAGVIARAIARAIGAHTVTPFHHSPRYAQRAGELHAELLAAWRGDEAEPASSRA
jgi:ribonuclease Z